MGSGRGGPCLFRSCWGGNLYLYNYIFLLGKRGWECDCLRVSISVKRHPNHCKPYRRKLFNWNGVHFQRLSPRSGWCDMVAGRQPLVHVWTNHCPLSRQAQVTAGERMSSERKAKEETLDKRKDTGRHLLRVCTSKAKAEGVAQ